MARFSLIALVATIIAVTMYCVAAHGAEFAESDFYPTIDSIVLTEDSVAVAVNHNYFTAADSNERQRFFAADRPNYNFRQIEADEFAEMKGGDHYVRFTGRLHGDTYKAPEWMISGTLCTPDVDPRNGRTVELGFGGSTVNVTLDCDTYVSDANLIGSYLWVTTYLSTDYFKGAAEGLLFVGQLDGEVKSRVDLGGAAARIIATDPWSSDVLVVTDRRLVVMTENRTVKAWREPVHGFDTFGQRPDVLMPNEPHPALDPIAIIAYSLGPSHYQSMYEHMIDNEVNLGDNFLKWYFEGSPRHRPQLPSKWAAMLADADSTYAWKMFACVIPGERAYELCFGSTNK